MVGSVVNCGSEQATREKASPMEQRKEHAALMSRNGRPEISAKVSNGMVERWGGREVGRWRGGEVERWKDS
jgi:hypothetical protein